MIHGKPLGCAGKIWDVSNIKDKEGVKINGLLNSLHDNLLQCYKQWPSIYKIVSILCHPARGVFPTSITNKNWMKLINLNIIPEGNVYWFR